MSDITYIRVNDGWNYLTTIIDLADRKVVGWSLSEDMTTKNTILKAWLSARASRDIQQGFSYQANAQVAIEGITINRTGKAISGVSLIIEGQLSKSYSNNKGYFRLESPTNIGYITASYIGYQTQRVAFSSSVNPIQIIMQRDSTHIDEVVVINTGYQQIPKGLGPVAAMERV